MNSFAKVRAPGSKGSKGKNQSKQSEISINFKQPFKLTNSPIEQPRLKVNNAPSVVHIIQRKSHKKQPQKTDRVQNHIHVIQPSHAKKGWKFSNINDEEDDQSNVGSKSQKSSEKQQINLIQIPKEQPKQLQQVLPHAQPVILHNIQQYLLGNNQKITYQRNLVSNIPPFQSSIRSPQSIKYEESSAHYLDIEEGHDQLNQIEIKAIVQYYCAGQKKFYFRNLENKHEQWDQHNDKNGKIGSMMKEDDVVQIYQLNEQTNNFYHRINLKRNLQHKQGSIFYGINEENLKIMIPYIDEKYNEKSQYNMIARRLINAQWFNNEGMLHQKSIIIPQEIQNNEMKILPTHRRIMNHNKIQQDQVDLKIQSKLYEQIRLQQEIKISQIRQDMNQMKKQQKLTRKLLLMGKVDDEGILYCKSIVIPSQENQYNQTKGLSMHRRNMNHNKFLQEEGHEHEQKVQNRFMHSQGIEINPIQQNMKSMKKESKLTRKLLVLQGIDGKVLNQQILIPQQYQQKDDRKVSSSLKRHFKIIQYKEQQPKSKSLLHHPLQVDINNQDIIIEQINQAYSRNNLKQSVKRNLLIINDPLGQSHYQQIIIPQQFQIKQAKLSSINQTRNIKHQLSHHEQSYKQEKLNSKVMPLPVEDVIEINVDPLSENYVSTFNKRPLQRKLLLVKDEKYKNIYQSILIPYAEQINPNKASLQSHKRAIKHLQAAEQHIEDKVLNEKVFQSIVREYPISKTVEIQQIFENVASSQQKQYQVRNLQLMQQPESKVSSQQIVIPQQFQQKTHQKFLPQDHKRHFNIIQFQNRPKISAIQSDLANRSSSINQKIEINSIQQEFNQSKKQYNITRHLLVIKNNNGEIVSQEIIIPQDQQAKSKENNLNYQKRQFKIVQIQNQPVQQPVEQNNDSNEYKAQKLNSKLPPPYAQYEQSPLLINQFQEETYHNNLKDNLGNFKLKRALLLIKNEEGKVFSQEIMIPNDEYQIGQKKSPPQTYIRSIKPTAISNDQYNEQLQDKPQKISAVNQPLNHDLNQPLPLSQQIEIDQQVQSKPIHNPTITSKRQIKPSNYLQILKKDQKLGGSIPHEKIQSLPQENQPNNSLQNPHQANEKSFNNPSTLNSSVVQHIILANSCMEQSNPQPDHKPLSRHFEASPEKLYQSAQNAKNEKIFNVYNPGEYLSQDQNAKIAASLAQSHQRHKQIIKPCRRPGKKFPQIQL